MNKTNRLLLLLFFTFFQYSAFSQVAVIVNKSVTLKSLSKERIIDIYSLSTQNWENGSKIIVFDFKGEHEIKTKFYESLDFSFAKMQKVWLRKQFSGAGMPPQTFRDFKEIILKVSSTPGAIAYVPLGLVTKDVIVVSSFDN